MEGGLSVMDGNNFSDRGDKCRKRPSRRQQRAFHLRKCCPDYRLHSVLLLAGDWCDSGAHPWKHLLLCGGWDKVGTKSRAHRQTPLPRRLLSACPGRLAREQSQSNLVFALNKSRTSSCGAKLQLALQNVWQLRAGLGSQAG